MDPRIEVLKKAHILTYDLSEALDQLAWVYQQNDNGKLRPGIEIAQTQTDVQTLVREVIRITAAYL